VNTTKYKNYTDPELVALFKGDASLGSLMCDIGG
jgi:hypothetical protein